MAIAHQETPQLPTQPLPPEAWDGHVLLRHQDPSQQSLSVGWISRGLERGEKILAVTGGTQEPPPWVDTLLDGRLPDEVGCGDLTPGCVDVVTGSSSLAHGGLLQARSRAREEGWTGVRVLALGFSSPSRGVSLALEDEMEKVCSLPGLSVLCDQVVDEWGHTRRGAEVTPAHRSIVHDRAWLRHGAGRLAVVGGVDLANAASLADGVARACASAAGPHQLTVDCSRWRFADISAVRALLSASEAFRAGGGRVHLTGVQGALDSVLEVVGGSAATGVRISSAEADDA